MRSWIEYASPRNIITTTPAPEDSSVNAFLTCVDASTRESLDVNHPDIHPIERSSLNLDGGMYREDHLDICRVAVVTRAWLERCLWFSHYFVTWDWRRLPNPRWGIGRPHYGSWSWDRQRFVIDARVSSVRPRRLLVLGYDVMPLLWRSPFLVRTYSGDRLVSATTTVVLLKCPQRTLCTSRDLADMWENPKAKKLPTSGSDWRL